jgi:hypothetical protein
MRDGGAAVTLDVFGVVGLQVGGVAVFLVLVCGCHYPPWGSSWSSHSLQPRSHIFG